MLGHRRRQGLDARRLVLRARARQTDLVGTLQPNLLTGSNVDIQLAEDISDEWDVNKSDLRVMIYAPAKGIVKEGTPIYSTQIRVIWSEEEAKPTTLVLQQSPAGEMIGPAIL